MPIDRENTCIRCGSKTEPAGISNQIEGRHYHGLKELADEEWRVCPKCYRQKDNGDWVRDE